jgi:hypothetical protein
MRTELGKALRQAFASPYDPLPTTTRADLEAKILRDYNVRYERRIAELLIKAGKAGKP